MQFFRKQTVGNVVLMGRRTFDSIGSRCLPDRYNVVVSHHFNLFDETNACKSASGIEDALYRASIAPRKYIEHFVIGGASMYEQFDAFVDRYLVTIVDKVVDAGDTFFSKEFDTRDWVKREVLIAPADSENEAAFSVWEFLARQPEEYRSQRERAITRGRERAENPNGKSARVRRARPDTEDLSMSFL
jgi:dihydrofolate reductase